MAVLQERRQHPRINVEWPVGMSTAHRLIDGIIDNISLGGAFIRCLELPRLHESAVLNIKISEHRYSITAPAEIVRFEDLDSDDQSLYYGLGVKLKEVSRKDSVLLTNAILYRSSRGSTS